MKGEEQSKGRWDFSHQHVSLDSFSVLAWFPLSHIVFDNEQCHFTLLLRYHTHKGSLKVSLL